MVFMNSDQQHISLFDKSCCASTVDLPFDQAQILKSQWSGVTHRPAGISRAEVNLNPPTGNMGNTVPIIMTSDHNCSKVRQSKSI